MISFEHEKYILTAEQYCLVRSFDEKIYICDTCHEHLSRNEMLCQDVFNKMSLDPIPDKLKDLKKIEKKLISKRIIFKKIAMHGKGEFAKIKGSICNIPYFSKTEDRCPQAMKQTAKEAFENNMHHHDTMKTIAKAYLNNHECSVQEAVYYILPELKLRWIFPAVYFVNTNPPEERVQALLSEKELSEPPGNSPNIFKKSNINRYMDSTLYKTIFNMQNF